MRNSLRQQLEYLEPGEKYQRLATLLEQPWSMLLDSCSEPFQPDRRVRDQWRRFDILCAAPLLTVSLQGDQLISSTTETDLRKALEPLPKSIQKISPFDFLRQAGRLAAAQCQRHMGFASNQALPADLPFQGGWMGYISYDIGRVLEKLPNHARDDLNSPLLQLGYYSWALITDHHQNTTCLYNFGLNQQQWSNLCDEIQTRLQAPLPATNRVPDSAAFRCGPWQACWGFDDYQQAFDRVKQWLRAGDCYQVNLAQRFQAEFEGDAFAAYRLLAQANQAPFSAWLNFPEQQILSLSPERFIEVRQRQVKTQPIKGTRPRSTDSVNDRKLAEALANSEKDRAENLMIVDLLRNDLSRTAAKASVKTSELFRVYSFESVHHLISTIESKLDDDSDCFDLLATTLPGGSITGAPKIRAMEIIDALEPFRRHVYCGVVGYISQHGHMDTNIGIRTLTVQDGHIYCWAGGGLVLDSDCQSEYQETLDKVSKILPLLNPKIICE